MIVHLSYKKIIRLNILKSHKSNSAKEIPIK